MAKHIALMLVFMSAMVSPVAADDADLRLCQEIKATSEAADGLERSVDQLNETFRIAMAQQLEEQGACWVWNEGVTRLQRACGAEGVELNLATCTEEEVRAAKANTPTARNAKLKSDLRAAGIELLKLPFYVLAAAAEIAGIAANSVTPSGQISVSRMVVNAQAKNAGQPMTPPGAAPAFMADAYGPGVSANKYGAAVEYVYQDSGEKVGEVFRGNVRRDAYGLGVHADEFGREVVDAPIR